jgi:polyhydroxybutyrate depolymerase
MMPAPGRGDSLARWIVRRSPTIGRTVAYGAALLVAAPIVYHLARGSDAYLGLFEDDFFYYSIVADKLVALGKLTYDGTTVTNGFHPLWFLVLLVLRAIAGGLNPAFFAMLTAVFLGAMVASYELARLFARALGASAALAPAVAVVHCVATDRLVSSGMETALDIPLLLWLFVELARDAPVTPRRAARLGAISSLAILARLDVALAVAMLIVGWLVLARPAFTKVWRAGLAFSAAGLAVPLYALLNLWAFGSVLPVSAQAKQLVKQSGFNGWYLRDFALYSRYGATAGITIVLGTAALFVLWRQLSANRAAVGRSALFAGGVALAFAYVFFIVNARSGWGVFAWYAYPLAPALVAALTLFGTLGAPRLPVVFRPRVTAGLVALATAIASVRAVDYFVKQGPRGSVEDNGLLAMSIELADLMRHREGVFGMGAVGGFATYELKKSVVQLEGLVADRALIEHIRNEDDLDVVLGDYHVDYLVVTLSAAHMDKHDGCYVVTEPNAEWAGERVAKMHGEICAEPIAYFPTRLPNRRWSLFSSLDTYVFDVRGVGWRPPAHPPRSSSRSASTPVADSTARVAARPYGLYVSSSYRAGAPAPLIVALHGLGGSGAEVASLFDLPALSDAKGFLYAFPDGTPDKRWGRFWNATDACCDFDASGVDDVGYLRAIVDDVAARYSVDARRIYLVGASNGGYLAHRAACELSDRVAAIVSVSGANWKNPDRCHPSEPVAVLEVHSDADPVVLYGGKSFVIDGRERTLPSAHETVATWAAKDGCTGSLVPFGDPIDWDSEVPGAETTRERYASCPAGAAVELWTVHGGAHIPGRGRSVGELALTFLEAHPKP